MEELQIQSKISKLKNILNLISDVSFQYKIIKNKYPITKLSFNEKRELIKLYEDLINQVKTLILTEYGGKKSTNDL